MNSASIDEMVKRARGFSVTPQVLDNSYEFLRDNPISKYLNEEEWPQFIFVNQEHGLKQNDTTFQPIQDSNNSTHMVITDQRVLFLAGGLLCDYADHLPFGAITNAEWSSGVTKNRISVWTNHHKYDFYLKRATENEEMIDAVDYLYEQEGTTEAAKIRRVNGLPPLIGTRKELVRVVRCYGLPLKERKYQLEFSEDRISFVTNIPMKSGELQAQIDTSDIKFSDVAVSERRDFEKENRSRAMNRLSLIRDSDMPTSKEREELVQIPLQDTNDSVTITPSTNTTLADLMDCVAFIDPNSKVSRKEPDDEKPKGESQRGADTESSQESPLEILKRRFAKGEIDEDEYKQKRDLLKE